MAMAHGSWPVAMAMVVAILAHDDLKAGAADPPTKKTNSKNNCIWEVPRGLKTSIPQVTRAFLALLRLELDWE